MAGQFVQKFKGRQRDGVLVVDDPFRFKSHLRSLRDNDLDIIVRKHKRDRSDKQNKYYFGVVISMISEHTGIEQMDTHEAMKRMFLSRVVFVPSGDGMQEVVISDSTAFLKTDEFEAYLERVKRWASSELHIVIPDPEKTEVIE